MRANGAYNGRKSYHMGDLRHECRHVAEYLNHH